MSPGARRRGLEPAGRGHEALAPLQLGIHPADPRLPIDGLQAHPLLGGLHGQAQRARLLPHAVPELCALFIPLAAWLLASRRQAWNELLAATFVTAAIAVPVLVAAAAVEVWVSPHVLSFLK